MNMEAFRDLLLNFIMILSNIISYSILIRVLLSWFSINRMNAKGFSRIIFDITDPVLNLFRSFNMRLGMIDLTPFVAMIVVDFSAIILSNIVLIIFNA